MADVQIPDMPAATQADDNDLLHLRQGETDKKITITEFNDSLVANLPNLDGSLDAVATSTNNYIITTSPPLTAYARGVDFIVRFTAANTGACTLNISGLGAKDLKTIDNIDFTSGDIKSGSFYILAFDDTTDAFHIINIPDSDYTRRDVEEDISRRWTFSRVDGNTPILRVINATPDSLNYDQLWYNDGNDTWYFTADGTSHQQEDNIRAFLNVGKIRLTSPSIATLDSTAHAFQVGLDSGINVVMDTNEIQCRNNGAAQQLNINEDGGVINLASNDGCRFVGDLRLENNVTITGKETGGTSRDLVGMSTSNIVTVGAISTATEIRGTTLTIDANSTIFEDLTNFSDQVNFNSTSSVNFVANGVTTFNNRPLFNGGISGSLPPFIVDSAFLVTNLNADLLDGVQGAGYALSSRTINTQNGVTGGGSLTGDLTLEVDIFGLDEETTVNLSSNDAFIFYDPTANPSPENHKIRAVNLQAALVTESFVSALNVDSSTVDGISSQQFLRSDVDDTATGLITFQNSNTEQARLSSTTATGSPYLSFYQTTSVRGRVEYLNGFGMRMLNNTLNNYILVENDGDLSFVAGGTTEFRVSSTGNGHFDGDVVAFSTTINSDIRLKNFGRYLTNEECLGNILRLKPAEFSLKRDPDVTRIGQIAQDVESVIPFAVKKIYDGLQEVEDSDHYLAIDSDAIISNLCGAIKGIFDANMEIRTELEKQKIKYQKLEDDVTTLKVTMKKLLQKVK